MHQGHELSGSISSSDASTLFPSTCRVMVESYHQSTELQNVSVGVNFTHLEIKWEMGYCPNTNTQALNVAHLMCTSQIRIISLAGWRQLHGLTALWVWTLLPSFLHLILI